MIKIKKEDIMQFMQENPRATILDLADRYGVTRQTISYKLKSWQINWIELKNEARKKQIEEFIKQNPKISKREIAEKLGVKLTVIENELRSYNLKTERHRKEPIVKKADIQEYLSKNPKSTITELAKHFNVSFQTMIRTLKRYDIKVARSRQNSLDQGGKERLIEYVEKNPKSNLTKMSKDLGVTYSTLVKYLKEYHIEVPGKRKTGRTPTKQEMEDYIELNPGTTKMQMAKDLDVSQSTIKKYVEKYNLNLNGKNNKYKNLTREELLLKIIQILKSVHGASARNLKDFLEKKGINVSETEIKEYQNKLLREEKQEKQSKEKEER